LNKREKIHHINGDKKDNRLKNLILFKNQSIHIRYHYFVRKNKKDIYIKKARKMIFELGLLTKYQNINLKDINKKTNIIPCFIKMDKNPIFLFPKPQKIPKDLEEFFKNGGSEK